MMKSIAAFGLFALTTLPVASAFSDNTTKPATLNDITSEHWSYYLGLDVGKNILSQGVALDLEAFMQGLKDYQDGERKYSKAELAQIRRALVNEIQTVKQQEMAQKASQNATDGAAYLAKLDTQADYQKTDSGVYYKVLTAGNGASPKMGDKIKAHYEGSLINGMVFDSSYQRQQPIDLPVGPGIIPAWQTILPMMKVGDQWQIAVPADQGYGERGAPPHIGPNEVLIFKIELLDIL